MRDPFLAISMGDPAGVGPEVILKAASVADVRAEASLVVFGDPVVLERAGRDAAVRVRPVEIERVEDAHALRGTDVVPVFPVSRIGDGAHGWGTPSADCDLAQVEYVKAAFDAVWSKRADAIVTAPINKRAVSRAGATWPGHTEMLAELSGGAQPLMMLAGPTLRVVPLTTHVPLKRVPELLSVPLLAHAIRVVDETFRIHFGAHRPRIAVAGLNPHAGEDGLFGDEEREIIEPAVRAAAAAGISVSGPISGDTVFHRAVGGEFDVVIGMYHDQALIPLKLLDFDRAVNVTLGLPIIRTSVDHGTAYDIAGHGVASAHSMIEALLLAARMVKDGWRARGAPPESAAPA
jgi:4-hydroxythreonine-4-phosphate dehydrogenase